MRAPTLAALSGRRRPQGSEGTLGGFLTASWGAAIFAITMMTIRTGTSASIKGVLPVSMSIISASVAFGLAFAFALRIMCSGGLGT